MTVRREKGITFSFFLLLYKMGGYRLKYKGKGVDNVLELEQLRTALEPYKVKVTEMGNSL